MSCAMLSNVSPLAVCLKGLLVEMPRFSWAYRSNASTNTVAWRWHIDRLKRSKRARTRSTSIVSVICRIYERMRVAEQFSETALLSVYVQPGFALFQYFHVYIRSICSLIRWIIVSRIEGSLIRIYRIRAIMAPLQMRYRSVTRRSLVAMVRVIC